MRFFLRCKCAYRNKYTLAGLVLVAVFVPANYAVCTAPVLNTDQYWGLQLLLMVVTGLFNLFGLFLISVTGVGDTTVQAYDTAMRIHEENKREFRLRFALNMPPCARAGWILAAEELGYEWDRE